MAQILSQGYSRIPVCAADDPMNFVDMLLVKQLIAYDSDDALPVKCFDLTPLPKTGNEREKYGEMLFITLLRICT
jgi:CBS domain containing-hemolysin-like protein